MKHLLLTFILSLVSLPLVAQGVEALEAEAKKASEERAKELTERLSLDYNQFMQLKTILEESADQLNAVRPSDDGEEIPTSELLTFQKQATEINRAMNKKLRKLFTKAQFREYRKYVKEGRDTVRKNVEELRKGHRK